MSRQGRLDINVKIVAYRDGEYLWLTQETFGNVAFSYKISP